MPTARPRPPRPSVAVLGDLMLDAVVAPARQLVRGTDVPGRVTLRQGGSAASTARWLGRLGAHVQLICSVGRDGVGRALIAALKRDGVVVRAARIAGAGTGRIGVLVSPIGGMGDDSERSFAADRGAADALAPVHVRSAWFSGVGMLHLPAYSLLGEPLGAAGRWAAQLARASGAGLSVDLASSGPLLAAGRPAAQALLHSVGPDIIFATAGEAEALLGTWAVEGLLEYTPVAVVKRGAQGATVLARTESGPPLREEVPTRPFLAVDTTGAGDAFDAGFLHTWLAARAAGQPIDAAVRRAALAGHRTATRQLENPQRELRFR